MISHFFLTFKKYFTEKAWIDINKRISDDFGQASHFDDYFDEKFIQISRKTIHTENEFAQMNMARLVLKTQTQDQALEKVRGESWGGHGRSWGVVGKSSGGPRGARIQ